MARKGKVAREDDDARQHEAAARDEDHGAAAPDDEETEVPVWVLEPEDEEPAPGEAEPAAGGGEAERLRRELAEMREQWVRALADLDNFRKRTEREHKELKRQALAEPMRELLPVVDNLERAVAAEGTLDDLKRGVEMVLTQVREVLRNHGVRAVPAAGSPFDPAYHDAVSRFEDEAAEVPTVAEELQRGYTFHDRLLRPALVKVAMPAAAAPVGGGNGKAPEGVE